MQLTGRLSDELYLSLVRGALALLPMLETPRHVVVLKALTVWKENDLLPAQVHEQLCAAVIAASRPVTSGTGTSAAAAAVAPATVVLPSPAAIPAKKQKLEAGQVSLFKYGERQRITAKDLREQREAASRDEDYEPEIHPVLRFPSESEVVEESHPAARHTCPKCPKKFTTALGLANHVKWHSETVKDMLMIPPPPKVLPLVECDLAIELGGGNWKVYLDLSIGGRSLRDISDAVAAGEAELAKRAERQTAEAEKRRLSRDKAIAEDQGEQRKGSARRGAYTARMKLQVPLTPHPAPPHPPHPYSHLPPKLHVADSRCL